MDCPKGSERDRLQPRHSHWISEQRIPFVRMSACCVVCGRKREIVDFCERRQPTFLTFVNLLIFQSEALWRKRTFLIFLIPYWKSISSTGFPYWVLGRTGFGDRIPTNDFGRKSGNSRIPIAWKGGGGPQERHRIVWNGG